ncbi:molybdenum ABC transporter ATP-binding protein [Thalassolituus sp. LLYu03]|uniref:molybdenum ABC transporter ATP-binding protein n=1 Tax=Thalassolituus sp. LLYu03 TaxID=3421656 RepID=UPI003D29561D
MSIQARFSLARSGFQLNLDLTLPAQGVSVIAGPSGCGKTTLLRCIAGLEQAQGALTVNGDVWQSEQLCLPTHRRPLAYVFQQAALFEHLTAAGNLAFAVKRARADVSAAEQAQLIELLGIGAVLQRRPAQLSGGERQRVAIARALLSKPQLLLMDEPLASLDEARKQEILPYLEQLKSTLSLPIIYVTHSAAEVARLADYLVLLNDGQMVASGTLNDTLTRLDLPVLPGEEAGVVLHGHVSECDSHWALAHIRLSAGREKSSGPAFGPASGTTAAPAVWVRDGGQAVGTPVRLRILARDVSVALSPAHDSSIQNLLPGVIEAIGADQDDALTLVRIRCGEQALLARMTRRSVATLQLREGLPVWAQVKSAALI